MPTSNSDTDIQNMVSILQQIQSALKDGNLSMSDITKNLSLSELSWLHGINDMFDKADQVKLNSISASKELGVSGFDILTDLMKNCPAVITVMNKKLEVIMISDSALKAINEERRDVIGITIEELSPDADTSGRLAIYKKVLKTGKPHTIKELKVHPKWGEFKFKLEVFRIGSGLMVMANRIQD